MVRLGRAAGGRPGWASGTAFVLTTGLIYVPTRHMRRFLLTTLAKLLPEE